MATSNDTIEIHLRTADQLFNLLDPAPFRERDLDERAERYIVGYARELRKSSPLNIVVTLPRSACDSPFAQHVPEAIRNYFIYRAGLLHQDLRELLRNGWRFLAIGIVVLALCFVAIRALNLPPDAGPLLRIGEQSLLILGWVANWRPIEIFLYDWLPLYRQIKLYERIAAADVKLQPI
jgi:hypothetical protein